MNTDHLSWWNHLRHGGLLLDIPRLTRLFENSLPEVNESRHLRLRRERNRFEDDPEVTPGMFTAFVLEKICGFDQHNGQWYRAGQVATSWTRYNMTGEAVRPNHLWIGTGDGMLPVFIDTAKRLGIGRGKRAISRTLQWLRKTDLHLALVTNGRQWRLIFAGMDYDAWCEWDIDQWLAEGKPTPELQGFAGLLSPALWTPPGPRQPCPLEAAVNDARKGQADLSLELGERVRQAAERLIQAHASILNPLHGSLSSSDIYRAAVRMIMRMVVVLFAESRPGLLPTDNRIYHQAYSLGGLREQLGRISPHRLKSSYYAYPRILALFRLIYEGSGHEALPVPAYGGTLFAPGTIADPDGMIQALARFERDCFSADLVTDLDVHQILKLLTRTKVKIRQGRSSIMVAAPVDFSSLGSEYIGILYEGLLDFELHCAKANEPIVFLSVGNQPALPLTALEAMDDLALKDLLDKLKDTSSDSSDADSDADEPDVEKEEETDPNPDSEETAEEIDESELDIEDTHLETDDARMTLQGRAEVWARHACEAASLVSPPRGELTPERKIQHERAIAAKARQLVNKVILPGEWYLVRWGGTRKGSGTFYTRPQLAVPTVYRTLMPLAYEPPSDAQGNPRADAPFDGWVPKKPEQILGLKVCDPACGSGTFPLSVLRFITDALYQSLMHHNRVRQYAEKSILALICDADDQPVLSHEDLPCRPEDDDFEERTKAILRRYVVERCIYGVDIDPLAVELCRLALWIETIDPELPMTFLKHKIKCGNSLVGGWYDTFLHYPAMAWNREGGDKTHTNGIHYKKEQWTKAVKEVLASVKSELKEIIDGNQITLRETRMEQVENEHQVAEKALEEIHGIGIAQVQERAEKYNQLCQNPRFQELKQAFDLWCALWFWPADQLEHAPLPDTFYQNRISVEARIIVQALAARHRFFHWELEFPDVFNARAQGFDAVMGNPPWDIAKPNSKEFFSAIDPLYRGYGKQEAIAYQKHYFGDDKTIEHQWLTYNAFFRSMANWTKFAGRPFGDRVTKDSNKKQKHDLPIGDRGRASFQTSEKRHDRWRKKRQETTGYADSRHPFCHQGGGDINLYKLFLEQAHALLAHGGRFGFIVPSGLYADHGTGDLRTLFLEQCKWEWLFGFENRLKIFAIHGSFKFNPVIIEKGGQTSHIRTAFMHRRMADWENAEQHVIDYPREQVLTFSPESKAILEIQSRKDLEILEKIYSNAVLLGDQSSEGWGVRYSTEFHMTNDSKLFPPRPKWEEWGYRPDEYSRWIKGPWQPIQALYAKLGMSPPKNGETRCAQPPYDTLAIPRADIPEGIILSRDAAHFIRETEIPEVTFTDASGRPLTIKVGRGKNAEEFEANGPAISLPFYEGRMIGQFDFSEKGWVSGKGRSAVWRNISWQEKMIEPQYLLGEGSFQQIKLMAYLENIRSQNPRLYQSEKNALSQPEIFSRWWLNRSHKISFMDICSATNERTMIATYMHSFPNGHSAPTLRTAQSYNVLNAFLNSFVYDSIVRLRTSGLHLIWAVLSETPLPKICNIVKYHELLNVQLNQCSSFHSQNWLFNKQNHKIEKAWKHQWAIMPHERLRVRCMLEALCCKLIGHEIKDVHWIFRDCDFSIENIRQNSFAANLNPKGFWRVDKTKPPEHRLTVLSLVAFHDLQQKIAKCNGDTDKGIYAFLTQNDGEGWMLPETLRLADYGLGHDDRAREHQPVRACFGPRFLDWQLAQTSEESWRECWLHARNLLGPDGYQALLDEMAGKPPKTPKKPDTPPAPTASKLDRRGNPVKTGVQMDMFDME
jgi:hypothetical protein